MKSLRNIKKDDKVKIIAGKDKGKISKVLKVLIKKERVLVENSNMVTCHTKPDNKNRQGGIIKKEASMHWSNIVLICNKCLKPVRIKIQFLDNGNKVRICKKCNEAIDN